MPNVLEIQQMGRKFNRIFSDSKVPPGFRKEKQIT
jgi:hypothetical protein